ncbi:hypothetical protein D3C73_705800 [compost metagenome]
MALAGVEHWFDGENHPGLQRQALPRIAVMQHLRLVVVDLVDAVATVLAHDAKALVFGMRLNGVTDVAKGSTGAHPADAGAQGVIGGLDQVPRLGARLAHEIHAAGVAVPAVFFHRDVDVDDVAVLQHGCRRQAMADHFVNGCQHRFRIAEITDVAGNRLLHIDDVLVTQAVEFLSGDACLHMGCNHRQHFGGEHGRGAGSGDVRRGVDTHVRPHVRTPPAD